MKYLLAFLVVTISLTANIWAQGNSGKVKTTTRTTVVHRKTTGVANARAHGGVAHAYGHRKHRVHRVQVTTTKKTY